jgi:lipopolysaccharide/colanic/teichoic acid biosynthesis glycosyltransferase
MTATRAACKRSFDIVAAAVGLLLGGWLIVGAAIAARIDTGASGIFRQSRVGRGGRLFTILKIRTMRCHSDNASTVTTARDERVTRLGRWLRKTKVDELPQLWNVLLGDMSFVGPRPDMPKYLPYLKQHAPLVLTVRPGITGPASLKYRNEEQLLASIVDPERYNDNVIFPDKVAINEAYVRDFRIIDDIRYLWLTVFSRRMYRSNETSALSPNRQRAA